MKAGAVSMNRRWRIIAIFAILSVASVVTFRIRSLHASSSPATPCQQVIAQCHAKRLPNLVLTGKRTSGALYSVDGVDLGGILSFDDALRRAWSYSKHVDAKTVQVVLGSADATALRWGKGKRLFYGIDWGGICGLVIGPTPVPGYSPPPTCGGTTWGTVIDAKTGAFIVEGSG